MDINVGLLGAFSAETVLWKIISGAEFLGFSKTLPSVEVWNKLSSTENGADPFLSLGIGILFLVGIKPLLIILLLITAFMYAFWFHSSVGRAIHF